MIFRCFMRKNTVSNFNRCLHNTANDKKLGIYTYIDWRRSEVKCGVGEMKSLWRTGSTGLLRYQRHSAHGIFYVLKDNGGSFYQGLGYLLPG
jgi:hypothetical protein